jgi:hypothetical protein
VAIDATRRLGPLMEDIQARADALNSARHMLKYLTDFASATSVLRRQEDTLAKIAGIQEWPVPSDADLEKVETELAALLPETDEEIQEVARGVASIQADPEGRKLIDRMTGGLKRADVAGITPWAVLVLVTWLLLRIAAEPGTKASNDLVAISIVVAMAVIIQNRK